MKSTRALRWCVLLFALSGLVVTASPVALLAQDGEEGQLRDRKLRSRFKDLEKLVSRQQWAQADKLIAKLNESLAGHEEEQVARERLTPLEAAVRSGLSGLGSRYRGQVSLPDDETVRIEYAFEDPDELEDWEGSGGKVAGGGLGSGSRSTTLWHKREISMPLTLEARLSGEGEVTFYVVSQRRRSPAAVSVRLRLKDGQLSLVAKARTKTLEEREGEVSQDGVEVSLRVAEERLTVSVSGLEPLDVSLPGELHAGLGLALKPGLLVERLVLQGPQEIDRPGSASDFAKGKWVDLVVKPGFPGWAADGKWDVNGKEFGVTGGGTLMNQQLQGREPSAYMFSVEVWVPAHKRKKRKKKNRLAWLGFRVEGTTIRWQFSSRDSGVEGLDASHSFVTLPDAKWVSVIVVVSGRGVEGHLGGKRVWAIPRGEFRAAEPASKEGFGLGTHSNSLGKRLQFRNARFKVVEE